MLFWRMQFLFVNHYDNRARINYHHDRSIINNYHHDRSARINHDYNIVHDYNDRARERVRGPDVSHILLAEELVRF